MAWFNPRELNVSMMDVELLHLYAKYKRDGGEPLPLNGVTFHCGYESHSHDPVRRMCSWFNFGLNLIYTADFIVAPSISNVGPSYATLLDSYDAPRDSDRTVSPVPMLWPQSDEVVK